MGTKVLWDGTPQDAEAKKAENAGQTLLEVQDHNDGKFLVFGEPKPLSTDERLAVLEKKMAALEKKP